MFSIGDVIGDWDQSQVMVVTGPRGAGKTTFGFLIAQRAVLAKGTSNEVAFIDSDSFSEFPSSGRFRLHFFLSVVHRHVRQRPVIIVGYNPIMNEMNFVRNVGNVYGIQLIPSDGEYELLRELRGGYEPWTEPYQTPAFVQHTYETNPSSLDCVDGNLPLLGGGCISNRLHQCVVNDMILRNYKRDHVWVLRRASM